MDKSKFGTNQEEHLDPAYHNGQSDAEQLMSRHLQSTEGALSDKDLEAIKIKTEEPAPTAAPSRNDDDADDAESTGSDRIITPLDVLGG